MRSPCSAARSALMLGALAPLLLMGACATSSSGGAVATSTATPSEDTTSPVSTRPCPLPHATPASLANPVGSVQQAGLSMTAPLVLPSRLTASRDGGLRVILHLCTFVSAQQKVARIVATPVGSLSWRAVRATPTATRWKAPRTGIAYRSDFRVTLPGDGAGALKVTVMMYDSTGRQVLRDEPNVYARVVKGQLILR